MLLMKNLNKKIISATLLVFFLISAASAQDNLLYNMSNVPQTVNTNPAKHPNCNLFIGFPALSSIYFDFNNYGFVFKDLFKPNPHKKGRFLIDQTGIENSIADKNVVTFENQITWLNFGFKFNTDYFFTFGISTHTNEEFMFPRDFVTLIQNGNYSDIDPGKIYHLGLKEDFMIYNEYAAGLSKQFYNGLTVGVRLKYLSGLVDLQTQQMKLDWSVNGADTAIYDWTYNTDFNIRSSVPVGWAVTKDSTGIIDGAKITEFDTNDPNQPQKFINDNRKSFLLSPNRGFGIDFGFDYKINDLFSVSGSVVDLGYIKWANNSKTFTQTGTFVVSGMDMAKYWGNYHSIVNSGTANWDSTLISDITDSLKQFINPKESDQSYKTRLSTKIFLGGNYSPVKWFNIGLLYKGYYLDCKLNNVWTLSGNLNFLKGWALSTSWSRWDKLNNSVGLGLAYKIGPWQMYCLSDNIAVPFWAVNGSSVADRWIRNTKKVAFHFGINFVFCKEKVDYGLID
jgi:hypothetical protein